MHTKNIIPFFLLLGVITLLSNNKLHAQSVASISKKGYYSIVFDKYAIDKLKKIDENEIETLKNVKEYELKKKDLETLQNQTSNSSTKNNISRKLNRINRRLERRKNKAYKKLIEPSLSKELIYKDVLNREINLKQNNAIKFDIDRLKDSISLLFTDAATLRSIASNFDRKEKSQKLENAFLKEKTAFLKYEKAIGILNQDPDFKSKNFVSDIKVMNNNPINDLGSSKPSINIEPNKNVVTPTNVTTDQINQFLGNNNPTKLDPKNTNFVITDTLLHKRLNLNPSQKKSLTQSGINYEDAQKLFKKVDASYLKIDEIKKAARSISDKDKRESIKLKSEAEDMERVAFVELNKAINLQLSSNETKHQVYRQFLDKPKGSSLSNDEIKRAKQLVNEANQYHNLSAARQKKAISQSFVSEKYTMLIEANELLQECVRREQNALALYLEMSSLTDQDLKLLELYDDEQNTLLLDKKNSNSLDKKKKLADKKVINKITKTTDNNDAQISKDALDIYKVSNISGLFYTIHLGSFKKEITKKEAGDLSPLVQSKDKKAYIYTYGVFDKEADAKKALLEAKDEGYKKAYITAYYNKENIEFEKGLKLAKEGVSYAQLNIKANVFNVYVGNFSINLSDEDFEKKFGKLNQTYKVKKATKNNKVSYYIGPFNDKDEVEEAIKLTKSLDIDCFKQATVDEGSKIKNEAKLDDNSKKISVEKFQSSKYKLKLGAYTSVLTKEEFKLKYGKLADLYEIKTEQDKVSKLHLYFIEKLETKASADLAKKKAKELGLDSYVVVNTTNEKQEHSIAKNEAKKETKNEIIKKDKISKLDKKEPLKDVKLVSKKDTVKLENEQTLKDVTYKLQIGEFSKKLTDEELNLKFKDILKYCRITTFNDTKSNRILYLVGEFKGYDDAVAEKDNLRKKGVFGTIIAFNAGSKVSLFQARRSEVNLKN